MKALADSLPDAPTASADLTSRSNQIAEAVILALLFAVPVLVCLHAPAVMDPDIWWHLRTGQWIVQHHAVPHTDPFTSFAAGKPWQAYSWLFELLVFRCFERLGLAGIVTYTAAMILAITVAIYHLIRRLQPDFSAAVLLTLAASLSLLHLFTPRPWLFTILFFTFELDILLHVRRTGKVRELLWLPLIFAVWANVHIQFIDGLVALGLALGESIAARWWTHARSYVNVAWFSGIFLACLLATLVNPYGWTIYKVAHDLATQSGALNNISEMQAIPFRTWTDYCLLFLALAASAALAIPARNESHRRFPVFETGLLVFAAVVSFRSLRDLWVIAIVAPAILAQQLNTGKQRRHSAAVFEAPLTVIVLALIVFVGAHLMHDSNAQLESRLVETMPVRAVAAIKEKGYPGPLYNTFDWGGYLIWDLRLPVDIDGRSNLDGDDRMNRSIATWSGQPDWASDPDLKAAALVIGPVKAPLIQLLRMDPGFQLAYEDKMAAVFTHKPSLNADR